MTRPAKPAREYVIPRTETWDGGMRLRAVAEGRVLHCSPSGHQHDSPAPLRLLARHHAADSAVWQWLRSHGVTRPSPSGPSGQRDRSREAPRPSPTLRLSPAATTALARLAEREGSTRVAVVERLILGAAGATTP